MEPYRHERLGTMAYRFDKQQWDAGYGHTQRSIRLNTGDINYRLDIGKCSLQLQVHDHCNRRIRFGRGKQCHQRNGSVADGRRWSQLDLDLQRQRNANGQRPVHVSGPVVPKPSSVLRRVSVISLERKHLQDQLTGRHLLLPPSSSVFKG